MLVSPPVLGAEGVEMGTRFIATKECVHAHERYKQALVESAETDTVVIKRSLGAPGRVLRNAWTEKILELERQGVGYEELKDYIIGRPTAHSSMKGAWTRATAGRAR